MDTEFKFTDIGDDARRQYIDAQSVFTALEEARKKGAQYRGGMIWKKTEKTDYLLRTQTDNSQKSLGPRSPETEEIYHKFTTTKATIESRIKELQETLERHKRMNRALFVGRAPQILVNILDVFARVGIAEHFRVIGTNALYAYESAAGIRILRTDALATQDVDLLWNTRKRLKFITQMNNINSSMIGLLQKVDKTFEIRDDQKFTAVNSSGFEVDIIRRDASKGDPHPLRLTDAAEDEFYAVQINESGKLIDSHKFTSIIVSASGSMARIHTISPIEFVKLKKMLSEKSNRNILKKPKDALQAKIVNQLISEYLPHLLPKKNISKGQGR